MAARRHAFVRCLLRDCPVYVYLSMPRPNCAPTAHTGYPHLSVPPLTLSHALLSHCLAQTLLFHSSFTQLSHNLSHYKLLPLIPQSSSYSMHLSYTLHPLSAANTRDIAVRCRCVAAARYFGPANFHRPASHNKHGHARSHVHTDTQRHLRHIIPPLDSGVPSLPLLYLNTSNLQNTLHHEQIKFHF